ncbi:UNVERIFIED_CONTAM: hypothetical protein FKN15_011780 [Acipenser sinensis]
MDSVKMESVPIKEEFPEREPVPFSVEFSGLAALCDVQCDSSQPEVSEIKAEHNELEISQTEELLPVKQEEALEIKQEPLTVEFDHMEPGKDESEDFKPNIPELEPARLWEGSMVLERICIREQGTGEEGCPNSMQGGGKEDGRSYSECSHSVSFSLSIQKNYKAPLLNRVPCDAMDSVEMESVPIKEELFELELVPFSVEFFGLACPPIKQELCEVQCDSSQRDVPEIKAEHNELEIPQTEELLSVKQEEVLEIKQECLTVEFDHMEPGKEESEDFKPNIPELEPVHLRKCSVVLERICMRERGTGEEGSPPNSTQGGGKEDGWSYSEYSLAGSSPAAKVRPGGGEYPDCGKGFAQLGHEFTQ